MIDNNDVREAAIQTYRASPTNANLLALLHIHIYELGANRSDFLTQELMPWLRDAINGGWLQIPATVHGRISSHNSAPAPAENAPTGDAPTGDAPVTDAAPDTSDTTATTHTTGANQPLSKQKDNNSKPHTKQDDPPVKKAKVKARTANIASKPPTRVTAEIKKSVQDAMENASSVNNATQDMPVSRLLQAVVVALIEEGYNDNQVNSTLKLVARMFSTRALVDFRSWLDHSDFQAKVMAQIANKKSKIRTRVADIKEYENLIGSIAEVTFLQTGGGRNTLDEVEWRTRAQLSHWFYLLGRRIVGDSGARQELNRVTGMEKTQINAATFKPDMVDYLVRLTSPDGKKDPRAVREFYALLRTGDSLRVIEGYVSQGAWHMFHNFGLITLLRKIDSDCIRCAFRTLITELPGIKAIFEATMTLTILPLRSGEQITHIQYFRTFGDSTLHSPATINLDNMRDLLSPDIDKNPENIHDREENIYWPSRNDNILEGDDAYRIQETEEQSMNQAGVQSGSIERVAEEDLMFVDGMDDEAQDGDQADDIVWNGSDSGNDESFSAQGDDGHADSGIDEDVDEDDGKKSKQDEHADVIMEDNTS